MSEMSIPQAAMHTPLATLLAQDAAGPELAAYRGALTPRRLDAAEKETAALAFAVAVHDLGWLRRVAVRGEDRFRWLSGMVTNTVNELGAKAGAWNLVLNAQGRIQGDLHVWREGEALELEIAADQYEKLLAHLDRFIIMDDVELAPLDGITALGLTGPLAGELLVRLGLTAAPTIDVERKEVSVESHPSDKNKCVARVGHPIEPMTSERAAWNGAEVLVVRGYGELAQHFELWIQAAEVAKMWEALIGAGARPVGADSLEAFRIAEGIPAYGVDIAERDLPQETSQMRALCFNKGCYLGQEIVERIRSRGSVHRHLRPLELFGTVPAAGAALTWEGGAIAGSITSAAEVPLAAGSRLFALGMIRGEAELRSQPLYYTAGEVVGTARILTAPPGLKAG